MSVFLNISNHPSDKWTIEQTKAAKEFAISIVDVKPPPVPPVYSIEKVEKLCSTLLKSIPELTTHAMVSTEYTLTAAIVRRLQKKDIVCFAATTERKVIEISSNQKQVVFKFIRFRKYPDLT